MIVRCIVNLSRQLRYLIGVQSPESLLRALTQQTLDNQRATLDNGAWAVKIRGTPLLDEPTRTSVWFTVSIDGIGSIEPDNIDDGDELGFEGDVSFTGSTAGLGDFSLKFTEPIKNDHPVHKHPAGQIKPLDRTFVHSIDVPEEALWQSKRK